MRVLSVASSYSDQPEACVITISRVKDASCPFRYFKEYVEQPRQSKPFETIEAGIGQFFHDCLAQHFREIMARGQPISPQDVLDAQDVMRKYRLGFIWEGRLRRPYVIVRAQQHLPDFEQRLQTVVLNFNAFLRAVMVGHLVSSVEGPIQVRTDELYIRGRHDLITTSPEGERVLWDWKTGRAPLPKYFSEFEAQKVQLGIYATWMRYKHRSSKVRGTAVYLRDSAQIQSEVFCPAVERDVLEYCANWRRKINGWASYPPIPNSLCDWCGWNPGCDAYRGRKPIAAGPEETPAQSPARKCFVASAVFENANAPEVAVLRGFRDGVLAPSPIGQIMIELYGILGPPGGRVVARMPRLSRCLRGVLTGLAAALERGVRPPQSRTPTSRPGG